MKTIIIYIALGIVAIFCLSSCVSSQKRLQRKIEKHGIKESVSFVIAKYPEYFKTKDTVIHDTLIVKDTVIIKADTVTAFLSDSSNFLTLNNDSISLTIDKVTNKVKIVYKERIVPIEKIIYRDVECPVIICPDCDDLKDNSVIPSDFPWWLLIVGGVVLVAFKIWLNKSK